ncbi:MAG: GNAT family N-acetyltransferase [Candidatus Lokiarchaeota archaeon]|nr:GNAT family N-acetyltransferase [Candidatus Lokiarchaeota archaeon]
MWLKKMQRDKPRIKIKTSSENDLDDLKRLMKILCNSFNRTFYEKPWLMDMKYRIENNPKSVIIAVDTHNDKIVGMVIADSGRDWYSGAILGQIINFIVHPDYRGLKIGTQLVDKSLEYLKSKNCHYVRTNCRSQLPHVEHIFEKVGFKEIYSVLEKELL